MALTQFVDRVPQQPNRKKIKFETDSIDLENGNYATIEYADNPTTVGTPLSADNLNQLVDAINDLYEVKRVKLFDGALQEGQITLNDIIGNYRFLVVRLSNGTSASDYKYGNTVMPVIEIANNRFDVMIGQTFKYQDNAMTTFTGEITTNGLNSNIINITVPFSQVVHKTGLVHSGNTEVYVKEIWGIR